MKSAFFPTFLSLVFGGGLCLTLHAAGASDVPLTQFVNPFIGTASAPGKTSDHYHADAGNVFPGAICPRGMVAWSADTTQARKKPGGYWYPDRAIGGFSLTHFSGRGVMYLMDIPFMPVIQPITASPGTHWEQLAAPFSHTNETASPGYYRVRFDNGIETELTATPRTGMARFTFPTHAPATLVIRAGSSVSIRSNEVTGFCVDAIGGGKRDFTIYFAAEFDRPFQNVKTWTGDDIHAETDARGTNCGAILNFALTTDLVVQARVAISYISVENARANLTQENSSWNFSTARQNADMKWNNILNRIQVEGGSSDAKETFYTALYHCFMHPNLLDDVNGQYPGMDGKIHSVAAGHHQYQNIPAWDQYRSLTPLISILTPEETSDIAQSLVNDAQQDASVRTNGGGLPRWEQVNHNSAGMVGDGDDAIIASAYGFGAKQFDTGGALMAMDKGASQPGTTSDGFEVRSGLNEYLMLGYVPDSVSITLEYCMADFALAQFANALGNRQKYIIYQNRAQNWKNLFDESTGLLRPKSADGSWATNFSPATKIGFTEGTAAQYVWMVNFNPGALIEKMGGAEKAIARLDQFFTTLNSGYGGITADMGNEPCEGMPWIYNFAGAPAGTQKVVHRIQNELFTTQPYGLPGNDDAGALSSWYVFSALGLYPEIPGVAGFVIGSPVFPKATIHLDNGAVLQIVGKHTSPENFYVQKLELNGRDCQTSWLPWSALSQRAVLTFTLGEKPSSWGNQPPPPFDAVKSQ